MRVIRKRNRPVSHGAENITDGGGTGVVSMVRVGEVLPL